MNKQSLKDNPKVLDTTDDFLHWKKIVKTQHTEARFTILPHGCRADLSQTHTCGEWDMRKRFGVVLHKGELRENSL